MLKGPISHTRAVLFKHGQYWLVIDVTRSECEHVVDMPWHFHPGCTVRVVDEGKAVIASRPTGQQLAITRVHGPGCKLSIVTGQERPLPQGWWSEVYNMKVPAPCAIFSYTSIGETISACIICTSQDTVPVTRTVMMERRGANLVHVVLDDDKFDLSIDATTPSCARG